MKKKFVLTLALVLMVAVTLSAATPVEVSGVFDFGYKMTIKDGLKVEGVNESNFSTFVAVSSDYWKVSLGGGVLFADKDKGELSKAEADIYLSKALADEGVDMGDLDVTLHVAKGADAPSVFTKKLENDLKVSSANANLGATIKYAGLVDVFVSTAVAAPNGFDTLIGAKFAPVNGVTAAVAYGTVKKAVHVSAAADIAKLADLDFALAASVGYKGDFSGSKAKTDLGATITGAYEGIGLWVSYETANLDTHSLGARVSYETTVEGFDLEAGVKVSSKDLAADKVKIAVDLDASAAYTMGDVKYKLALGYALKGDFTVTPSISFAF